MEFSIPRHLTAEMEGFREFLQGPMSSRLSDWHRQGELPREFFEQMGGGGWYGFDVSEGRWARRPALREALIAEAILRYQRFRSE